MNKEKIRYELRWLFHVWCYPNVTRKDWEATQENA